MPILPTNEPQSNLYSSKQLTRLTGIIPTSIPHSPSSTQSQYLLLCYPHVELEKKGVVSLSVVCVCVYVLGERDPDEAFVLL